MSTYPIKGIPLPSSGTLPKRREIDSWWNDPDCAAQQSLFVRALTAFKELNPVDPTYGKLSYFQVAGIHGEPSQPWDGAPCPEYDPKVQQGGYCAHSITTFPTWHRPYMLLFEQRLWEIMQDMIAQFPIDDTEKKVWYDESNKFRLPYWDWGTPQQYSANYGVPELLRWADVQIVVPGTAFENTESVPNPLDKFSNPLGVTMGDKKTMGNFAIPPNVDSDGTILPWDQCVGTSRYGLFQSQPSSSWADGVVNNSKVDSALQNHNWYAKYDLAGSCQPIQDVVYRLFSDNWKSWKQFSTTQYNKSEPPVGQDFLSLEFIHNNIHNWVGGTNFKDPNEGTGHMYDISVSAFDPSFWLHHCNIDRLLAVWQILNPKKWFDPSDPLHGDTPLQPFHVDVSSNPWTSNLCRCTRKLNYTYNDLAFPPKTDLSGTVEDEYMAKLRKHINLLYGTTRKALLNDGMDTEGNKNDYLINIVYDRFAFNGSPYTIYFFLGEPEHGGATCLGSVFNFSSASRAQDGQCANCKEQRQAGILSKASIPITTELLNRAVDDNDTQLPSLRKDPVEGYLERKLAWRVMRTAGPLPADTEIPGLKVFVMKGTAIHHHDDTKLSSFHDYRRLKNATKGKLNGLQPEEADLALEPNDSTAEEL